MSEAGHTLRRNRAGEAAEQERTSLQEAQRCITCKRPSKTQRCDRRRRAVEANTERSCGRGLPMPRPPTRSIG